MARLRCSDCSGIATSRYPCKRCGSTEVMAHTHGCDLAHADNRIGRMGISPQHADRHTWDRCDKAHEHPHDGHGHTHDLDGKVVPL